MRKLFTGILVTLIMVVGILGITNPARRQPFQLFDKVEGKVTHNYFIFSVYQQYNTYQLSDSAKYQEYKRYVGIAMNFFEISPVKIKQDTAR